MSTALAVRKRPHTFAAVAGQQHVVEVLKAAAARRPVPQQILLAGPSGVGKTTLARIFAAGLFCPQSQDGNPCGACATCLEVTGPGGRHPDVIELDAASHGGIDKIRSLADEAHLAPMKAPLKVYIIDEAHGLSRDGAQAFLRLLEEPPAHTVFVLATTDPEKLPDALRGRCLLCYATPVDRDEKVANLARICAEEGWNLGADVLEVIVDGTDTALGVRGTVTNLDKVAGGTGHDVDAARAAALLGVADPALFTALVAAVQAGERGKALASLTSILALAPRSAVHAQLTAFAHDALRRATALGAGVEVPVWWLTQLADRRPEHLEIAVAKMTDPHLGGAEGLPALVERAEAAAAALSATPPPSRPSSGVSVSPTPAVPGTAVDAHAPKREAPTGAGAAHGARAAQSAAVSTARADVITAAAQAPVESSAATAEALTVDTRDGDRAKWMNSVSRQDSMCALWLNRATVRRTGEVWVVEPDGNLDRARFLAALTAGLAESHPGHTVALA